VNAYASMAIHKNEFQCQPFIAHAFIQQPLSARMDVLVGSRRVAHSSLQRQQLQPNRGWNDGAKARSSLPTGMMVKATTLPMRTCSNRAFAFGAVSL